MFVNAQTPALLRPSVDSVRKQAAEAGRGSDSVKVVTGLLVIVAETDE